MAEQRLDEQEFALAIEGVALEDIERRTLREVFGLTPYGTVYPNGDTRRKKVIFDCIPRLNRPPGGWCRPADVRR